MTMVRTRVLRSLLAVVALTAATAGCGGGGGGDDGGDDVASIDTEGTADEGEDGEGGEGGDGEATEAERQDAALEFAQCMRDHGIDMPDPEVDEDGGVRVRVNRSGGPGGGGGAGGPGSPADEEAFAAAEEECGHIMEDVFGEPEPLSPEEEAKMRDDALAFAQCMRDHGIDMPDPEFEDGGISMRMGGPGVDPEDPDFQAAQEECEPLMGAGPARAGTSKEGEG